MAEPKKIRLLVVDDHGLFAGGLELLLAGEEDMEIVGSARSAEEGTAMFRERSPDVVLMDIDLPDGSGIDLTKQMREGNDRVAVVVVSAYQEHGKILAAFEAGASAYVPKTHAADQLVDAIRKTSSGEVILPPDLAGAILGRVRSANRERASVEAISRQLTSRERQILSGLAEGKSPSEIAGSLHISVFTVRGHVRGILGKLGARSMREAVAIAFRRGLIGTGDEPTQE